MMRRTPHLARAALILAALFATAQPAFPQAAGSVSIKSLPADYALTCSPSTVSAADAGTTTTAGQNGQSIVTGTPTTGSFILCPLVNVQTVKITVTGTFTATLNVEASEDNATYVARKIYINGGSPDTAAQITAPVVGYVNTADQTWLRIRVSAFTSAPTVTVRATGALMTSHVAGQFFPPATADALAAAAAEASWLYNGATYDRAREVIGDAQPATGLPAVVNVLWNGATYDRWPGSAALGALVQVATNAAFSEIVPANTTGILLKSGAGKLTGLPLLENFGSSPIFYRFVDTATAPTCSSVSSANVKFRGGIPVNSTAANGAGAVPVFPIGGVPFTNGIGVCITGAIADNDNTTPTAGVGIFNATYQ